jgi:hypothetical protein
VSNSSGSFCCSRLSHTLIAASRAPAKPWLLPGLDLLFLARVAASASTAHTRCLVPASRVGSFLCDRRPAIGAFLPLINVVCIYCLTD